MKTRPTTVCTAEECIREECILSGIPRHHETTFETTIDVLFGSQEEAEATSSLRVEAPHALAVEPHLDSRGG